MTEPYNSSVDPVALFHRPAQLGRWGAQARQRAFGDQVWIRPSPPHDRPTGAIVVRDEAIDEQPEWPAVDSLQAGDRLVVQITSDAAARSAYVSYLRQLAPVAPTELSIAPCSIQAGGMHRLWCIAATRVLLPDHVRVEARHDLLGIRLAQLAVGFGADTLAGPIEADRTLPLAGVTRPDENTPTGLATLVRQVGLCPHAA